jgi:membrane-bound metal-dependent hydrolase YbcI (DUF457 family)
VEPTTGARLADPLAGGRSPDSKTTAWVSALVGTLSHIALDSIMHADFEALWPFVAGNRVQGVISTMGFMSLVLLLHSWRWRSGSSQSGLGCTVQLIA